MPGPDPVMRPAGALEYAGFGPRFAAYLIDALILALLMLLPMAVSFFVTWSSLQDGGSPSGLMMVVQLLCYLVIAIIGLGYQLYFVGAKGATPGKKIMKLKVALPDGSYPIGYGKAFVRLIGTIISGMICYIGFLMILFDKETHKALHDKIAGTIVIREP